MNVGIERVEQVADTGQEGKAEGLVRAAAATYARRNLRINAIAPGLTDTPLAAPLLASPAARFVTGAILAVDGGYLVA